MFTSAHAARAVMSAPDAATDDLLDGAYAGWDSRVHIAPLGEDPFAGLADEDLLHGHAGVIAAMVMAQANQMRVLDSAIVPDCDLVRPTESPSGKFNEFEVYTPLTPPEKYVVFNEHGEYETVVPSSPFYPGLGERADAVPSPISLGLEDCAEDPYMVSLATGAALLQIGVEAGYEVSGVAEILNKAWGLDAGFSSGTIVGMEGAADYSAIYAQDRGTSARRLASWQECSTVRSGQLVMQATDWGPDLHCDFRRIRVAAESLFATSRYLEARPGSALPSGKITYHIPSTSLLSANPAHLFFWDARPEMLALQAECPAAATLLEKVREHGVLRAVWPHTEPRIAQTWAATFAVPGGLALTPVEFVPRPITGGTLFGASTARLTRMASPFARGVGNTVMTELSAKLATVARDVVSVQDVGWLAKFAAVVEILRLCRTPEDRVTTTYRAWDYLGGTFARNLERSMSRHHMAELHRLLPRTLRDRASNKSAKVLVWSLLLEVGNPATKKSHTILKGVRHALTKARELADRANLAERVTWAPDREGLWISRRLGVLTQFWAVQYAALPAVVSLARILRSDVRNWVEIGAAVNYFRAGYMRSIVFDQVAYSNGDTMAALRVKPYHAAAALAKALRGHFTRDLPYFGPNSNVSEWVADLSIVVAPDLAAQVPNIPRCAKADPVTVGSQHFTRGAMLLTEVGKLAAWMDRTLALVADDCDALAAKFSGRTASVAPAEAGVSSAVFVSRLEAAMQAMAAEFERIVTTAPASEMFEAIEEEVPEDVWDDFLLAVHVGSHPMHAEAVAQKAKADACRTRDEATAVVRWIIANFEEEPEATGAVLK